VLLGWQQALGLALLFAGVAVLLSPGGGRVAATVPWVRETAVVLALYGLWQEGLILFTDHVRAAVAHGMWVWRVERSLRLPNEASLQREAFHWTGLVRALDDYYAIVHVPAAIVCLLWLFWRHRDRYRPARNAFTWFTIAALALQAVPVAPPRLLPATGVIDAARLLGQSVYAPSGLHDYTQLTAMPSVHVGWSVLIAMVVVAASTSPWRWLILAHPVITIAAVVVTGNHFWLDGIVAAAMVAAVAAGQHAGGRLVRVGLVPQIGRRVTAASAQSRSPAPTS